MNGSEEEGMVLALLRPKNVMTSKSFETGLNIS